VILVLAVYAALPGCAAPRPPLASRAAGPPPGPPASAAAEPLDENAVLFMPPGPEREREGCDLLVHFHGAPEVVRREFDASGLRAALLVVNFRGLSAAYEKPFSEAGRFADLLAAARQRLVARGVMRPVGEWSRVWLSSFSAGYGAVRAILSRPEYFVRVDGIYLADSLYAGYADEPPASSPTTQPIAGAAVQPAAPGAVTSAPARRVNPVHTAPFRRFAAEAVAGRKVLIVTHSYLVPGAYAGTHETAADLLRFVRIEPRAMDEGAAAQLRIVSRAEAGGLRVYGCAGDTGADHMAHLRNLRWGLGELSAVSSQLSAGSGADFGGRR
jgi:hypothetical protein